ARRAEGCVAAPPKTRTGPAGAAHVVVAALTVHAVIQRRAEHRVVALPAVEPERLVGRAANGDAGEGEGVVSVAAEHAGAGHGTVKADLIVAVVSVDANRGDGAVEAIE